MKDNPAILLFWILAVFGIIIMLYFLEEFLIPVNGY